VSDAASEIVDGASGRGQSRAGRSQRRSSLLRRTCEQSRQRVQRGSECVSRDALGRAEREWTDEGRWGWRAVDAREDAEHSRHEVR
jgi:hypothetical protein